MYYTCPRRVLFGSLKIFKLQILNKLPVHVSVWTEAWHFEKFEQDFAILPPSLMSKVMRKGFQILGKELQGSLILYAHTIKQRNLSSDDYLEYFL